LEEENANKKVEKYEKITRNALEKIEIKKELTKKEQIIANRFMEMAKNYYADAKYFQKQGKILTAIAAFSYAHAWLDAGIRAELFDGKEDDKLFTIL